MKHFYVAMGNFKIPLRAFLKQTGKLKMYDTVKRRMLLDHPNDPGDITICQYSKVLLKKYVREEHGST
jgi:hypothetical protein